MAILMGQPEGAAPIAPVTFRIVLSSSSCSALHPLLPCSLAPSLPCSLAPLLPCSLTPSLPCSLAPSLPHSLAPLLARFLACSLAPWLPPLLARSLPPLLARSLALSLCPSLPRSLTLSLARSLPPMCHVPLGTRISEYKGLKKLLEFMTNYVATELRLPQVVGAHLEVGDVLAPCGFDFSMAEVIDVHK